MSGTRSGSHKMLCQHFEVMKSIWGGRPNVEPVPFGIYSILDDNSVKEGSSHNNEGESGVNDNGNAT